MKKRFIMIITMCLVLLQSLTAQEVRKYEIGADASFGFGDKNQQRNNYSFSVFGGYKVNNSFSVGAGLNYTKYQYRQDLPSGIDDVYIITDPYQAFRPFVYAHYDFLPNSRWTPYVDAKLGYAFFSNSQIAYGVNPFALTGPEGGTMYGLDTSEFNYLKDLDHSLGIKGNVYTSIGVGASLHLGKEKKGGKLNFGVSMDLQPVKFSYYNHPDQKKVNFTIGPKLGYTF